MEKIKDIEYQIKNCKSYLIECTDTDPLYKRTPFINIQRLKKELRKLKLNKNGE